LTYVPIFDVLPCVRVRSPNYDAVVVKLRQEEVHRHLSIGQLCYLVAGMGEVIGYVLGVLPHRVNLIKGR